MKLGKLADIDEFTVSEKILLDSPMESVYIYRELSNRNDTLLVLAFDSESRFWRLIFSGRVVLQALCITYSDGRREWEVRCYMRPRLKMNMILNFFFVDIYL